MFYKTQDLREGSKSKTQKPQHPLYEMGIKLESLRPLRGPKQIQSAGSAPYRAASNLNLNIQSFIYFKKKKKLLLTILSGPHVHKKSREQYKIDHFGAYFKINVPFDSFGSESDSSPHLLKHGEPTVTNEQKSNWPGFRSQIEARAQIHEFKSKIQIPAVRMTFIHSRRDLACGFLLNPSRSFSAPGRSPNHGNSN